MYLCHSMIWITSFYLIVKYVWNTGQGLGLWRLTTLATIFQLYCGCQFYWGGVLHSLIKSSQIIAAHKLYSKKLYGVRPVGQENKCMHMMELYSIKTCPSFWSKLVLWRLTPSDIDQKLCLSFLWLSLWWKTLIVSKRALDM